MQIITLSHLLRVVALSVSLSILGVQAQSPEKSPERRKGTYKRKIEKYTSNSQTNKTLSPEDERQKTILLLQAIAKRDLPNTKKLMESGMDTQMVITLSDVLKFGPGYDRQLDDLAWYEKNLIIRNYSYQRPIPLVYYAALKGQSAEVLGYILQKATGNIAWSAEDNNLAYLVSLVIRNSREPGVLYKFLKNIPEVEREYYLRRFVKVYSHNLQLITAILDKFKDSFDPNYILPATYPKIQAIKLLVDKYGADINSHRAGTGKTLLHKAVRDKRESLVEDLLALNADPNTCDHKGRTPLQLAENLTKSDSNSSTGLRISQLLEDAGALRGYECTFICSNYGPNRMGVSSPEESELSDDETSFEKYIRYVRGTINYQCA